MKKCLLAVQYWNGDKDKACRLARLIADIEPVRRQDVDFLFVVRFDSSLDDKTVKYVSKKFDTKTYVTRSRSTGHPWGSWALWFSTVEWFYHMLHNRRIPKYDFIFTFEGDCVPTSRNWINECANEFNKLGAFVVGGETFHWNQHINGNLMLSGDLDFLKWLVYGVGITGVPPAESWDIYLFPKFVRWGVGFTKQIWNVCGKPTMDRSTFEYCLREISFVHGVKDDSLYNMSRDHFAPASR